VSLIDFYYTKSWKTGSILAIKRLIGYFIDGVVLPFDHFIAGKHNSIYSSSARITERESKKIAIIATHILTPTGINNFIFPLAELLAGGFQIYIVDSGPLRFSTQNKKVTVIKRKNLGRDFGSFRDVLKILDLNKTYELILMNDSCYWSEGSMKKYLTDMTQEFSDVRCITLSFQKIPHPQSYFLHIMSPSISVIQDFFENEVRNWKCKRNVVKWGEIGLARHLNESGCKVVDLFGGHNSLFHEKKEIPLNFMSTNTMLSHPQEVFRLIGVIKVSKKYLLESYLESKTSISPEHKTLFHVI
jgi:hypothetical protein